MVYLSYDGSFEGFLSAIFEVYHRKLDSVHICKQETFTPPLFGETITIHTGQDQAKRVLRKIEALAGKEGIRLLWKNFLSEQSQIEDRMLQAIRYLLVAQKDIFSDYGDPHVLHLRQTEKKMNREAHRMTAFVRFQLGSDGLYCATVEPDFDVLPLISSHFEGRYADQRWLIYDLKRKYGIYYDLQKVDLVTLAAGNDSSSGIQLQEEETIYQLLWKDYFTGTNIRERRNMKLHLQHVPRRYWKYLTEKI